MGGGALGHRGHDAAAQAHLLSLAAGLLCPGLLPTLIILSPEIWGPGFLMVDCCGRISLNSAGVQNESPYA